MHALLIFPFLNHLADLSRVSASALIAAIWQGALLAVAAALTLRFVPRIPAAARFAVWFAVFTLIAALPFAAFTSHNVASISTSTHALLRLDSRWTIAIAIMWAMASLFRAATLIAAALRVSSLSRNAAPIAPDSTSAPATSRRVQVCSSTDIDRPTVIGFFAPKILIPAWLLEKLTPAELDHVILHESGHLNRADDWLNLLQKLALVIFPLNPALAWVERRLCFERELACDERVLAALAERNHSPAAIGASYASSLTTLAQYRVDHRGLIQNLALALGALGTSARQSELGRRVARILQPAISMKPLHVRFAAGTAILALLLATTELDHSPQLIAFASPSPIAQLATSAAPTSSTLVEAGAPSFAERRVSSVNTTYHAVAARITLPAVPRSASIGDAAPRLAAAQPATIHSSVADLAQPHAVAVHAGAAQRAPGTARMIATSTDAAGPTQASIVITRYTVTAWQSADGYRVVRTRAVISDAPPAAQDDQTGDADSVDRTIPAPPARQILQPYAAVPVPGGWLVFEL